MKNLIHAHIHNSKYKCSAEREISLYNNVERHSAVIMIRAQLPLPDF